MLLCLRELGVVTERIAHEVGELRERLDPGIAGADEDEGQLTPPILLRRCGRGRFEPAQDVVAQVDRVGERL